MNNPEKQRTEFFESTNKVSQCPNRWCKNPSNNVRDYERIKMHLKSCDLQNLKSNSSILVNNEYNSDSEEIEKIQDLYKQVGKDSTKRALSPTLFEKDKKLADSIQFIPREENSEIRTNIEPNKLEANSTKNEVIMQDEKVYNGPFD